MKFFYPAVIRKVREDLYEAHFPDLEQCTAEGRTMDEVIERAKEAELNWVMLELEDNLELPRKSEPSDIVCGPDEIVQTLSVTLRLMEGYDE